MKTAEVGYRETATGVELFVAAPTFDAVGRPDRPIYDTTAAVDPATADARGAEYLRELIAAMQARCPGVALVPDGALRDLGV